MITEVLETKPASELSIDELQVLLENKKAAEQEQANAQRRAYEDTKQSTIVELCNGAMDLNKSLVWFKKRAFDDLSALYKMLQEYSKRHKDGKGNFEIEAETPEGAFRIEFARQNLGGFDERADQAERHIIDFVNSQFNSDPTTKELITSLLERSKGKLDIKLVQKLYAMENAYDDPNWKEGIRLLKESWKSASTSRDYARFFKRDENGVWQSIDINFSSVKIA